MISRPETPFCEEFKILKKELKTAKIGVKLLALGWKERKTEQNGNLRSGENF